MFKQVFFCLVFILSLSFIHISNTYSLDVRGEIRGIYPMVSDPFDFDFAFSWLNLDTHVQVGSTNLNVGLAYSLTSYGAIINTGNIDFRWHEVGLDLIYKLFKPSKALSVYLRGTHNFFNSISLDFDIPDIDFISKDLINKFKDSLEIKVDYPLSFRVGAGLDYRFSTNFKAFFEVIFQYSKLKYETSLKIDEDLIAEAVPNYTFLPEATKKVILDYIAGISFLKSQSISLKGIGATLGISYSIGSNGGHQSSVEKTSIDKVSRKDGKRSKKHKKQSL